MSRAMNAGPPAAGHATDGDQAPPAAGGTTATATRIGEVATGATGPRPGWPLHDRVESATTGELTLIRAVDLLEPLPALAGGEWTRVWLLVRLGDRAVGELVVRVPEGGLTSGAIGAAVAARFGAAARLAAGRPGRASDLQPRSRSLGRTRSA